MSDDSDEIVNLMMKLKDKKMTVRDDGLSMDDMDDGEGCEGDEEGDG